MEKDFNPQEFANSFIQVAKEVLTKPSDFFAEMSRTAGFGPPVTFLAICLAIEGILGSLIAFNPMPFAMAIVSLIFAFIGAWILQFVLQQLFQGKGTYEGTFRVVAYSGVVHLLGWIPFIGFLASLYGLWLQIVGLEKVHEVSKGKAFVAVIITAIIFFLIMIPFGGLLFVAR